MLHTAPNLRSRILQGDWATIRDDYHWHIEIVAQPERVNRVGGIFVNETPPRPPPPSLREAWSAAEPRASGVEAADSVALGHAADALHEGGGAEVGAFLVGAAPTRG